MGRKSSWIAFKDFIPDFEQKQVAIVFSSTHWDTFDSAVAKANRWIEESGVEVLNLETVVLPNPWAEGAEGTTDAELSSGRPMTPWYQVLRVWFRADA
ncbi:MAG: hypothetical protein KIS92_14590 [Planctomycetota bacterium]|nr:hypothetical protein [Planctomycetota bacterium]